jgi:hypothetical protein
MKGNDFFDSVDENSKIGRFNNKIENKPVQAYQPYVQQNFSKKQTPISEKSNLQSENYDYNSTHYQPLSKKSEFDESEQRNPYSIIEDYGFSNLESIKEQKNDTNSINKLKILNVDNIVANMPSQNVVESNESESFGVESLEPNKKNNQHNDLRVVKPVSIKDQIMLNLNNDSIVVGEEIILDDEKEGEIPVKNRKVTNKIMETFSEDFYKPYENDAQNNMNYLLDQKLKEEEDVEVIKRNYGKSKRITKGDLDEFIRNGLRGTDKEIKNRIEYQKESMLKKKTPQITYQKISKEPEVISYPNQSLPSDHQRQIESRIQTEMLKKNESEILKGMRHTLQEEPKIYYKTSGYATLQAEPRREYHQKESVHPLPINNASIGPDIVRFTHENGMNPIIVEGQKYYNIEELPDYDKEIVYRKGPIYESGTSRPYTEYRETIQSRPSRGTYQGIGSMVLGGKSGMRLNYQSHLDDIKGSSKYSKYY